MHRERASRLLVLRHAHSSWAIPGQRDHQRVLDGRGQAESAKLAAFVAAEQLEVDHVVCSTAARASETWERIVDGFARQPTVEYCDDLYALGVEAYYACATRPPGKTKGPPASLMLVGHNPMIEEFVLSLCGSPNTKEAGGTQPLSLKKGFPTGGLAIVEFGTSLEKIEAAAGTLVRLVDPAEFD